MDSKYTNHLFVRMDGVLSGWSRSVTMWCFTLSRWQWTLSTLLKIVSAVEGAAFSSVTYSLACGPYSSKAHN